MIRLINWINAILLLLVLGSALLLISVRAQTKFYLSQIYKLKNETYDLERKRDVLAAYKAESSNEENLSKMTKEVAPFMRYPEYPNEVRIVPLINETPIEKTQEANPRYDPLN